MLSEAWCVSCLSLVLLFHCGWSRTYVYKLYGEPDGGYYITVGIGTPPRNFNVLIDTGSSNFAIAAYDDPALSQYFDESNSSTYMNSGKSLNVNYTQGSWKGSIGTEKVVLKSMHHIVITSTVDLALIRSSQNIFSNISNWQGLVGLGYQQITLSANGNQTTPFLDSLVRNRFVFEQSHSPQVQILGLTADSFSLLLCPPTDSPDSYNTHNGGNLSLGASDHTQYKGDLYTSRIVQRGYYQVLITDIRVGNNSLGHTCLDYNTDKSIIDSGTTNLRLPANIFQSFVSELKAQSAGAGYGLDDNFWSGLSPACHTDSSEDSIYSKFPTISLDLYADRGQVITLHVAPQQYLRPTAPGYLNRPNVDCYKIGVSSSDTGSVIGAIVMEGYYMFFDRQNALVHIAQTTCKQRDATSVVSTVTGSHARNNDSVSIDNCLYMPEANLPLPSYAVALIVIGAFLFVILIIFLTRHILQRKSQHKLLQDMSDLHDLVEHSSDDCET